MGAGAATIGRMAPRTSTSAGLMQVMKTPMPDLAVIDLTSLVVGMAAVARAHAALAGQMAEAFRPVGEALARAAAPVLYSSDAMRWRPGDPET